ncbi:unnamed protein product [Cuscuta epithymum]|uniref:pectinesterase n=1 Tax=Cuscuta epithymum TaxID=186058 RepID=A0AAV0EAX5_9ASTE|nr:unnamed protein product [Cuscuta epithymum]
MGTVKFKDYGVLVDPEEDQASFTKLRAARKRRLATAISVAAVFVTLIVGAVFVALIHHENHSHQSSPSSSLPVSSTSTGFLSTVCAVTQHPHSCFDSMSPFPSPPKPSPEHFLNVSLWISINELVNLTSLPKSLISKVNDRGGQSALQDCESLFNNALSQLNESAALINADRGEIVLAPTEIGNMRTWISAGMTDEDTCTDGLEEMQSTVTDEVKAMVQRSNEYMSNTLAIVSNLQSLHEKFGVAEPKH